MPLYFVKCDLDDSTGNREKDYKALTGSFQKKKTLDSVMLEKNSNDDIKMTGFVKKTMCGLEVARGCWIVEFEGGGDYLSTCIKNSSGVIRENDKLIIAEMQPQNMIMQHPNKYAIYEWMHNEKEEAF